MKKSSITFIILGIILVLAIGIASYKIMAEKTTKVLIETNYGNITVELDAQKAPISVANFLSYVNSGFYTDTIFHRVIKNFMIQGGGFDTNGIQKPTKNPITIESQNGLKNLKGTIAMARTSDPNSATSQFFINTNDNDFLNYGSRDQGYAVFGKVTSGMDVVLSIQNLQTNSNDEPLKQVIIKSIKVI